MLMVSMEFRHFSSLFHLGQGCSKGHMLLNNLSDYSTSIVQNVTNLAVTFLIVLFAPFPFANVTS